MTRKNGKSKAAPAAKPKVHKPTIASTVVDLARRGKTNAEITEVLKAKFHIPERHLHYAGWYRAAAVRSGKLPKSFAVTAARKAAARKPVAKPAPKPVPAAGRAP
jgi:hypothetical protein